MTRGRRRGGGVFQDCFVSGGQEAHVGNVYGVKSHVSQLGPDPGRQVRIDQQAYGA